MEIFCYYFVLILEDGDPNLLCNQIGHGDLKGEDTNIVTWLRGYQCPSDQVLVVNIKVGQYSL